jgi:hypothetical protein
MDAATNRLPMATTSTIFTISIGTQATRRTGTSTEIVSHA